MNAYRAGSRLLVEGRIGMSNYQSNEKLLRSGRGRSEALRAASATSNTCIQLLDNIFCKRERRSPPFEMEFPTPWSGNGGGTLGVVSQHVQRTDSGGFTV